MPYTCSIECVIYCVLKVENNFENSKILHYIFFCRISSTSGVVSVFVGDILQKILDFTENSKKIQKIRKAGKFHFFLLNKFIFKRRNSSSRRELYKAMLFAVSTKKDKHLFTFVYEKKFGVVEKKLFYHLTDFCVENYNKKYRRL